MVVDSQRLKPWQVAIGIGLIAEILFLLRLATPNTPVFDETHYVPAARVLMSLGSPSNIEHPLLGKEIIALGIMMFGDNSFGWRFFSTIAATAVVLGVFWITWQLLGRVRPAVIAAVLTLLNFTVYIQARIAMLDGFMAAFVVLAIGVLLWAASGPARWTAWRLALAGVLIGMAVATKWAAIPVLGLACAAIPAVRWLDARRRGAPAAAALAGADQPHFAGVATIPALLILAVTSLPVYFATFAPAFFFEFLPLTWDQLLPYQLRIYAQQTAPLPQHHYQSSWWSWPLDIRPIWYLYEVTDGAQRGILMVGNPAVMLGGLAAVGACAWLGWRQRLRAPVIAAALWLATYLPWIIIPKKIGFFYYYYLPSIFLCVALAVALDHFGKGRWRHADLGFTAIALMIFLYFLPIISAAPLADALDFRYWMLLPSWP